MKKEKIKKMLFSFITIRNQWESHVLYRSCFWWHFSSSPCVFFDRARTGKSRWSCNTIMKRTTRIQGQLHVCVCAVSHHVSESEQVHIWSSHCSRSSSEERISFPLGQKAWGELMRGAHGPCKIDHESRSIQIKVNTATLACSVALVH